MKNYKAKKRFGQNFLKDDFILEQIVQSASKLVEIARQNDGEQNDNELEVVEIGPGLGDLSAKLLNYFDLVAYEVDSELCCYLKDRFPNDNFRLQNVDVLRLDSTLDSRNDGKKGGENISKIGWLSQKPYVLVSNLPYYIATRIIVNALKDKMCRGMVVMTQREVAEKFLAKSGESEFCAISVLNQSVAKNANLVAIVPPSAFEPSPKVESAVFSILKNENEIEESFEDLLKAAFSQPRKKVAKNLSHIKNIAEILETLGINPNARAHQLTTSEYHQIFKHL